MNKDQIREEISGMRDSLSEAERTIRSAKVIDNLKKITDYENARSVMYYVSFKSEVFTHPLVQEALGHKRVIVPKVNPKKNEIVPCLIKSFDELSPGFYDILEPESGEVVGKDEIDAVIVPGIAFDARCNRVGYGAGYYDRFMKDGSFIKIGLGFDFQMVDNIEPTERDIKLDYVVTESGIIKRK